jgi:cobalt/nickel transport system permease protein
MKRSGFIERTMEGLYAAMERTLFAEESAAAGGLLQSIDPRVKLLGLMALILAAAMSRRLTVVAAILAAAVALAAASRISPSVLAARVWAGAFAFTAAIAFPALFLTPGPAVFRLPWLGWALTEPGLRTSAFLILRVETAATLALLLVFTTRWTHVLKALRAIRVPVVFVVILGMSSRYIYLMLEAAHEMFESRKSRTVGALNPGERRRMAISCAGVLLGRTFQLSNEVYLAMQARGFRGEVYVLDDFRMLARDWAALAGFAVLTALAVWAGR